MNFRTIDNETRIAFDTCAEMEAHSNTIACTALENAQTHFGSDFGLYDFEPEHVGRWVRGVVRGLAPADIGSNEIAYVRAMNAATAAARGMFPSA